MALVKALSATEERIKAKYSISEGFIRNWQKNKGKRWRWWRLCPQLRRESRQKRTLVQASSGNGKKIVKAKDGMNEGHVPNGRKKGKRWFLGICEQIITIPRAGNCVNTEYWIESDRGLPLAYCLCKLGTRWRVWGKLLLILYVK